MSKWIAEFDLEDGDTMPEHMDLEYKGAKIDFHCRPMWIPCNERHPEKSEWYLLTAEWDDGLTTVTKDRYVVGEGWTCAVFGAKCLAWQPLPTPYREGRQE